MQFIRLLNPIDIAERVLPELGLDWINTRSVPNIDIRFLQRLRVNMPMSSDIEWLKTGMRHRHTFRTFTHRAWAIWDTRNYDWFWKIPDPGRQKRITLSVESIITKSFQARTGYDKIPEWGEHSCNCGMQCLISIFGSFRMVGDQPNEKPGTHSRCQADILSNIPNCEIQHPGMQIARKIGQMILIGRTNHWHNCHSGRKRDLHIPPPITRVYVAIYSAICLVQETHRFKIEVHLKREMCQKELYRFQDIPVL